MSAIPPAPQWSPEPPKLKKSTVYKVVIVIALVLLAYWLWRVYKHLPPAHPLQYPAAYIPAAARSDASQLAVETPQ